MAALVKDELDNWHLWFVMPLAWTGGGVQGDNILRGVFQEFELRGELESFLNFRKGG